MRVVIDTVVWLRALIRPRSPCGRILFTWGSQIAVLLSTSILREVVDVLTRPELARRRPEITPLPQIQFVLQVLSQAEAVDPTEKVTLPRDPKDEKFLECAVGGRAQYIVSEDKDLLSLGEYQGIKIVTCQQFLDILEATQRQ